MVRVDFDDRAHLLAEQSDVYYVTEHYAPYNAVLVRLSRVSPDVLRDLLGMAHKFVTECRAVLAARKARSDQEIIEVRLRVGDRTSRQPRPGSALAIFGHGTAVVSVAENGEHRDSTPPIFG